MSLTPQDLALLGLAREADEPSPEDRERVRGALARQLGAAAVLTAAAAASRVAVPAAKGAATAGAAGGLGAMASLPVAAKVGMAVLLVVGAASAPAAVRALRGSVQPVRSGRAETVAAPVAPRSGPIASPTSIAPPAVDPAPVAGPSATSATAGVPAAPKGRASPKALSAPSGHVVASAPVPSPSETAAAPAPPPTPADRLAAETALVREATTAVGAGDAARALALLERHAREFPGGALAEDRDALAIRALCQLGRAQEATRAAKSFLQDHPFSSLAASVRQSCASSGLGTEGE